MAYSKTSRSIRLEPSNILTAYCRTPQGAWLHSTIHLSTLLGNYDGEFRWGGTDFEQNARNIRLEGKKTLKADLMKHDGTWNAAEVNLDEGVTNMGGMLRPRNPPAVGGNQRGRSMNSSGYSSPREQSLGGPAEYRPMGGVQRARTVNVMQSTNGQMVGDQIYPVGPGGLQRNATISPGPPPVRPAVRNRPRSMSPSPHEYSQYYAQQQQANYQQNMGYITQAPPLPGQAPQIPKAGVFHPPSMVPTTYNFPTPIRTFNPPVPFNPSRPTSPIQDLNFARPSSPFERRPSSPGLQNPTPQQPIARPVSPSQQQNQSNRNSIYTPENGYTASGYTPLHHPQPVATSPVARPASPPMRPVSPLVPPPGPDDVIVRPRPGSPIQRTVSPRGLGRRGSGSVRSGRSGSVSHSVRSGGVKLKSAVEEGPIEVDPEVLDIEVDDAAKASKASTKAESVKDKKPDSIKEEEEEKKKKESAAAAEGEKEEEGADKKEDEAAPTPTVMPETAPTAPATEAIPVILGTSAALATGAAAAAFTTTDQPSSSSDVDETKPSTSPSSQTTIHPIKPPSPPLTPKEEGSESPAAGVKAKEVDTPVETLHIGESSSSAAAPAAEAATQTTEEVVQVPESITVCGPPNPALIPSPSTPNEVILAPAAAPVPSDQTLFSAALTVLSLKTYRKSKPTKPKEPESTLFRQSTGLNTSVINGLLGVDFAFEKEIDTRASSGDVGAGELRDAEEGNATPRAIEAASNDGFVDVAAETAPLLSAENGGYGATGSSSAVSIKSTDSERTKEVKRKRAVALQAGIKLCGYEVIGTGVGLKGNWPRLGVRVLGFNVVPGAV